MPSAPKTKKPAKRQVLNIIKKVSYASKDFSSVVGTSGF